ncbi:hypothetical protein CVT24_002108 [Panaeolus cyanescens]|uniref:DUF6534 domain-containing protein n=1 Tax=Panaeolus cyanescens TaxID=181874 RepID=A0A409YI60_9AGAR|nr:hypothetical protein CVT24_002108 [Panaeolus cyanescens]
MAMLKLDDTLGAAFIGNILAGVILDTVHLALVTEGLYYYLITNYANPIVLADPHWTFLVVVAVATISAGTAFAIMAFHGKTFAFFSQISYLMYMALGSAVAADILIATSLCYSLSKTRTGYKQTDSVVNVLMMYVINSSLLTTVCALGCLVAYAIWPNTFAFIGIYFCLSKLFLNSLLAMLNGRDALKSRVRGTYDGNTDEPRRSLVLHSPGYSATSGGYTITSFASKDAFARENLALSSMPRVVINVDKSIETKTWDESVRNLFSSCVLRS